MACGRRVYVEGVWRFQLLSRGDRGGDEGSLHVRLAPDWAAKNFLPRPTDRRIPKHPLTTTVLNIDRREAVLLRLGSVFEQCARERDACEERQIWCEVARSRVDYLRLYTSHVAERVAITGWMIRRAGWLARAGTRPEP